VDKILFVVKLNITEKPIAVMYWWQVTVLAVLIVNYRTYWGHGTANWLEQPATSMRSYSAVD